MCKRTQIVEYCNNDANADTFTCKKLGIKNAKRMCVQKTLEQFCEEDANLDTRICKRLNTVNVEAECTEYDEKC